MNSIKHVLQSIMKWTKSPAGVVSICLLGVFALLMIPSFACKNEVVQNIFIGIATNFIGIIVTVSFVQYFLDRQKAKDEKSIERDKILRRDKVLRYLIAEYSTYFNCIVTPMNLRNGVDKDKPKNDFVFADMADLHQYSLLLADKLNGSAVESFYRVEMALRDYFITCINDIDYTYYHDLIEPQLGFITSSLSLDVREAILGNKNVMSGNEPLINIVKTYISEDEKHRWVERFDEGHLEGNLMIPYVILYKLLKKEGEYIREYNRVINRVRTEKSE